MTKRKLDTQSIGLDVGLTLARWLTGRENLHYGYWSGLEVSAANLGPAQEAYTEKLFGLLPDKPCRILDIGGGAGETARKLLALGHEVEIVVPSPFLAERCRANAPEATVHLARFEEASLTGPFDVCLFSESFQYVPLDQGLAKSLELLAPGGRIVIADCFRREGFRSGKGGKVGGGHRVEKFRALVEELPVSLTHEEEITEEVAPSVEVEQGLFNILGHAVTRVDEELAEKRPGRRRALTGLLRTLVPRRKREKLMERLTTQSRNRENFAAWNRYLMLVLEPERSA